MSRVIVAVTFLVLLLACSVFQAGAANIVWVNEFRGDGQGTAPGVGEGNLTWEDDQWRALLEGNGHTVQHGEDPIYFTEIDFEPDQVDLMNSADLVIVSRDSSSGNYNQSEEEIQLWTDGITVPMIVMTPYHMRSGDRWRMVDATGVPLATDKMEVLEPAHPIFNGVQLDAGNQVEVWDGGLLGPTDDINLTDALDGGNGQVLAMETGTEYPWIILWEKGVEFFDGSDTFAGNTRLFFAAGSDDDPNTWGEKNITPAGDQMFLNAVSFMAGDAPTVTRLQAGDANQDLEFNQLDLVQVQIAAKYLSGTAATWGEGDWDAAPGGQQGSPPAGNGFFDQLDIIAALAGGKYLTGPYSVIGGGGRENDGQTSIKYDPATGELAVDAPAGTNLTSVNIDSAAGVFTGEPAQNLGGSFDNDADGNIFKATFGSSFGSLTFGNVAQAGLSEAFVMGDLTVVGSLEGGGDLGAVDLIYVPEPSSLMLSVLGWIGLAALGRRRS